MRSVLRDDISFKGGAGKALVDTVKYSNDDGDIYTQNVYQTFPQQQQAKIEYRTDPEQAKTIADLQSRLDALTQSTKARELEIANAPKPVPGITQEQVDQQLASLRSTLGSQYTNERTKALSDLRSQLSGEYASQMNTLRQTLGQQSADQLASQRSLFQTNIDALRSELSTTRTGYEDQIGGLKAQIKTAQEADIQRQQRARVTDAYANSNRQRVSGVKAARSPEFTSTGARRTVSSQFGRSGMRISSLNI
tara:strand:- start:2552 stop:3304 length:753 start_codon:yes stop_codon:yes gene_type:complete